MQSHGPNNLPPLRFHHVHGDNIRLSRDGALAKRYESFNKGVTFSDRPVEVNERVFVKFSEISNNWSGVIRFGFTYNDPNTQRNNLPKYACPDLTNRPGFWAKALNERYCERDNILFYYVTSAGEVYFGINGEEKGVFISGVETRGPLWALIDVYGNCSAIEFLDSRVSVCRNRPSSRHSVPSTVAPDIDHNLPNLMQSLNVNDRPTIPMARSRSATSLRNPYTPVPFHRMRGRNVVLSPDKLIATRVETEFCQGYVFTARPIRIGEKLIVQVLRTEPMYVGALALGLTSCDPATLRPADLPDDSDLLLDRPEYWVVSKDVASNPIRGDEIIFSMMPNGEVQISKNNGPPTVVMHVDQSLTLWAFLDVYGSTQSVRVLSHLPTSQHYQSPISASTNMLTMQRPMSQRYPSQVLPAAESVSSIESIHQQQPMSLVNHSRNPTPISHATPTPNRVISSSEMIQLQSGGTVLVVNLPPATSSNDLASAAHATQPQITQIPMVSMPPQHINADPAIRGYNSNYVEVSIVWRRTYFFLSVLT